MKPPKDDMLPCLNGIRFLSMMWVIVGHTVSVTMTGPIYNTMDLLNVFISIFVKIVTAIFDLQWAENLRSMFLISGGLSVDTFFVVGAALLVYGFFKTKNTKQNFNILLFYFHRYIRLGLTVFKLWYYFDFEFVG